MKWCAYVCLNIYKHTAVKAVFVMSLEVIHERSYSYFYFLSFKVSIDFVLQFHGCVLPCLAL